MRVLFWFLALALVSGAVGAALNGCGKGNTDRPEIVIAAALLPSEQQQYVSILDDFTSATGIEVRLVAQQYEEIRRAVEAEADGGRGRLDVVELDVYQLPLLSGAMQSLAPLIESEDELQAEVAEVEWRVGMQGNPPALTYVPHRLNWQALIYDAEAIAEPPADWNALLAAARNHSGRIGLKLAKYEGLVCDIFPFIWQAGGDPLRPDSAEVRRAMEFLRELRPHFSSGAQSYREEPIRQAQELREIVLHPNWPFVVPIFAGKKLLPDRIRTAPLPAGPAGAATVLGGGYLGIPATAPHPAEAGKLVDFLTSSATQRRLTAQLGWFPIRDADWEAFSDEDRALYSGFVAMREHVRARPNVACYPDVSAAWQQAVYAILFEDQAIDDVLGGLQQKIDEMCGQTEQDS